jgi:anti-sigma factor RsiW
VTHLGDQLSALVDGELSGAELDKANAHMAACGTCRAEANALRRLKQDLRALAEVIDCGDMTRRLLAMPGQAGPPNLAVQTPIRHLGRERVQRRRIRARRRSMSDPYSTLPSRRLTGRRRGRYLLWSALSLVVVGIGTTAFGLGGSSGPTGPQIKPQLEVYDMQHAITSGDVPFDNPADVSARVPVVAATP